jgi:hypothetical protein
VHEAKRDHGGDEQQEFPVHFEAQEAKERNSRHEGRE